MPSLFKLRPRGLRATTLLLCAMACAGAQAAVQVNIKMALLGASTYDARADAALPMHADLINFTPSTVPAPAAVFPLTDPYGLNASVPGYGDLPQGTVDWVKVELLAGPNATGCVPVQAQAGFLLANGNVVGTDGQPIVFALAMPGSYNIRISHRNHAALISLPVNLLTTGSPLVDLTQSANLGNPLNAVSVPFGVAAIGGNANGDMVLDTSATAGETATDAGNLVNTLLGGDALASVSGYLNADLNMNGNARFGGPGSDLNFLNVTVLEGFTSRIIPNNLPLEAACGAGAAITPPSGANVTNVPTLSEWAMLCLAGLLVSFGLGHLPRRRRPG